MANRLTRILCATAATLVACVGMLGAAGVAHAEENGYQIYPTPQSVQYADGTQTLREKATAVIEDGIDEATVARLDEAVALKGITCTKADAVPTKKGTTAILVGVKGSGGAVDKQVDALVKAGKLKVSDDLFGHTDAYVLASLPSDGTGPDQVIVLGNSTDAAFYGLTTLYQILQQTSGSKLRAFTVADYADVITRGFIEGYYGNPWSTEDRVNLMKWGGYYKLNAYVYAPKDDPKHNAKWRELYTQDEIDTKIKPLAEAGNASKCRFLFALHPFMYNPITKATYDADFEVMKAKFKQVIDAGVRQIAILADDAGDQGSDLYTKLCQDTTAWIRELQDEKNPDGSLKYPGLKDTIIFCPVAYYGQGEAWYKNLPDNIQVVNTGGQVWGKVRKSFLDRFSANSQGVAPFMWVNWPCSDNDKDALHMGGHNNFLGADVQPGSVKGVVLNPMQQSEPSKQGIFMNADFSWNLWTSTEHADQAWEDSFSYVDHNSPLDTKGSRALRDLSTHMRRMYGGGVTWLNDESADIKDQLAAFTAKLNAGTVEEADVDEMVKIFTKLQATAKDYRANAGNADMLEQMDPWISTWDDLTRAALEELAALKASLAGDNAGLLSHHGAGTTALAAANNHGFHYVDHTEYARVGKAYITPAVNALSTYVAEQATLASDPNAVITKFITSRTDTPDGGTSDVVFDGDASTQLIYKTPNTLKKDTYFGVQKSRAFDLDNVTFRQGGGKDFMDRSKIQYFDGTDWKDVPGSQEYTTSVVTAKNLGLKGVYGVRLIAVADNAQDAWPTIAEIQVNVDEAAQDKVYTGNVTFANQVVADANHPAASASDGKDATEAWFKKADAGDNKDTTQPGASVTVTFDEPHVIDAIVFKQGGSVTDVIESGKASYQTADGTWHDAGAITAEKSQTLKLAAPVEAKAIKVENSRATAKWWRVGDLHALKLGVTTTSNNVVTTIPDLKLTAKVGEGTAALSDGAVVFPDGGGVVAIDLGCIRSDVALSAGTTALPEGFELVWSQNACEWNSYKTGTPVDARFVGVRSTKAGTVTFAGLSATFAHRSEPSYVSGDLGTFDASAIFDGDVSTAFKNKQGATAGNTVVFDLGWERTINSVAYYVPEGSLDFIRNAVIEVSNDPKAADGKWTEVLKINGSTPVENAFNSDTAKTAAWLTHDPAHPGNMMTANPKTEVNAGNEADPNGTEKLNVKGRYLRIRFTGTYTHRWVEIGEIQLNGGEYISPYIDADFEQSAVELRGMTPDKLVDGSTATLWQSSAKTGTLTYHVSEPLTDAGAPKQGVRILSSGTPSGATVKAVVYTDETYTKTAEVTLGKLDQLLSEFTFSAATARAKTAFAGVKDIQISWEGTAPQLAEIYLLDEAAAANKAGLQEMYDRVKGTDTSGWTAKTAEAFKAALATAAEALGNANATQEYVDAATATLSEAFDARTERYAADELGKLVEAHVANDGNVYTEASYGAYEEAYNEAAAALKDAANLSRADGEALAQALAAARDGLAFNASAADRAEQMLADAKAIYAPGTYTTASRKAFDDAAAALQKLVDAHEADPAKLTPAMDALTAAEDGLVDTAALVAERTTFEQADEGAYTPASFAAWRAAYDASDEVLASGSAEQVAAAVKALQDAKAVLQALDIDALIAECDKLNADDYTAASWKAFAAALDAAKEHRDAADAGAYAQKLIDARAALVNVEALKDAIAQGKAIDAKAYTVASVDALNKAVAAGEALLEDGSAADVEAARQAILDALHGLVANGGSGQGGSTGQGGSSDQGGSNGQKPGSGSGSASAGKAPLPKTGDASMLMTCAASAAGVGALAIGYARSKKRR